LEGLRLEELVLHGNPLCDKYQDKNQYIRYGWICLIHIWATAGQMRPSTSFDPALIDFSELTHIKLISYDTMFFPPQGLFCDSSKYGYRFKKPFSL
jgi:hypothetical protein